MAFCVPATNLGVLGACHFREPVGGAANRIPRNWVFSDPARSNVPRYLVYPRSITGANPATQGSSAKARVIRRAGNSIAVAVEGETRSSCFAFDYICRVNPSTISHTSYLLTSSLAIYVPLSLPVRSRSSELFIIVFGNRHMW